MCLRTLAGTRYALAAATQPRTQAGTCDICPFVLHTQEKIYSKYAAWIWAVYSSVQLSDKDWAPDMEVREARRSLSSWRKEKEKERVRER